MENSKTNNRFWILAIILAVILITIIASGMFLLFRPQQNASVSKNNTDKPQVLEPIRPAENETKTVESISVSVNGSSEKSNDADAKENDAAMDAPAISMDKINTVYASSELSENGMTHSAGRICDGRLENAWVEGASGAGVNESIVFTFDGEYKVSGMNINAGYQKNQDIYYKNARPQSMKVTFSDGTAISLHLEDICGPQNITFEKPVKTNEISVMIESVYPGNKYEDLAISELAWY